METDRPRLEQALMLVDQELSYLREERRAFEDFREQIRLASADSADSTGPSETTEHLLSAYRELVMENLDYETAYDDTIAESLETELSPSLARVFLSKEPLTQRRKRDLLIETTAAIDRREEFCAELAEERTALEMFAEELAEIGVTLENLPTCSVREHPLEKLLIIWEKYNELLEQSDQLLEQRQQQIRQAELSARDSDERYTRNEFSTASWTSHTQFFRRLPRRVNASPRNETGIILSNRQTSCCNSSSVLTILSVERSRAAVYIVDDGAADRVVVGVSTTGAWVAGDTYLMSCLHKISARGGSSMTPVWSAIFSVRATAIMTQYLGKREPP